MDRVRLTFIPMRPLAFHLLLASCLLLPVVPLTAAEPEFPLVDARECSPRSGLPNFLTKVKRPGAELRVGYLGGSITAQPGWRVKSLEHFQKTWPEARISEINAAIGGTGSDLGVCRLKQDVLDRKPDLLFVEFAVNDGGVAPEQIIRCMEGIVRQTWRALPECDICFVYTITEALVPPMLDGRFQRSASAMEKVAAHYGIPSIHLGMEVARLAKVGKLEWKAKLPVNDQEKKAAGDKFIFAPDSVHPHVSTGHELYLQAIVRSWEPISRASTGAGPHELRAALNPDNYERARLVPISITRRSPGIQPLDVKSDAFGRRWAERLPDLHSGSTPGETITFKFKGTRCALYDIVGPDCGQVMVTLDDRPARVVPRFDAYCTYHRLSTLMLGDGLPDVVHSLKIEIHPEQPDKAAILARNKNSIDNPERFNGTKFFPGALLLVGDVVD
jgi:lysophospholipase L1-like esterase